MTTTGTERKASRPVVQRAGARPPEPARRRRWPHERVRRFRRPVGAAAARRWEALDGLRGFATTVMIAYHLGVPWLPGGVITMDMFFTLSGFLITGLLLAEYDRRRRISLRTFYSRRAKRLLPAMLVALTATVLLWRLTAEPSQLPGLRRDALSTLGYVANWHFAFDGQSYFDQLTPPSPLLHTWSLAVEEQFYLLWPILVIVFLRIGGKRLVLRAALIGALLFTAPDHGVQPRGCRHQPPLLRHGQPGDRAADGSALAIALPGIGRRVSRRRLLIAGLLATAWLGLEVRFSSGEAAWIYRGGFLAIALAISVVIVCLVVAPKSALARWFRMPPWPFLGRISYGLYLFHWPIFLYVTPSRTGLDRLRAVRGPGGTDPDVRVPVLVSAGKADPARQPAHPLAAADRPGTHRRGRGRARRGARAAGGAGAGGRRRPASSRCGRPDNRVAASRRTSRPGTPGC